MIEKTIPQRINELEAHMKTVEDLIAEVTRVFLGAPKETAKPEAQPTANEAIILSLFPEALRQHLTIKEGAIYTEFVAPDRWREIHEAALALGYSWISDKKNSRWCKT